MLVLWYHYSVPFRSILLFPFYSWQSKHFKKMKIQITRYLLCIRHSTRSCVAARNVSLLNANRDKTLGTKGNKDYRPHWWTQQGANLPSLKCINKEILSADLVNKLIGVLRNTTVSMLIEIYFDKNTPIILRHFVNQTTWLCSWYGFDCFLILYFIKNS